MKRQQPNIEGQTLPMTPPGPLVAVRSSRRRIVIIAASLLLLALCAVGLYLRRDTFARGEGSDVRLALDQGKVNEAAIALEHWLKASPDSAEAHYLKARLAWSVSNLRAVEEELTRATELGYTEQQTARLKGLLLARGYAATPQRALLGHRERTGGDGGEQRPRPVAVAVLARVEVVTGELAGPRRGEVRAYLRYRQVPLQRDFVDDAVHAGDVGHADVADKFGQQKARMPTSKPSCCLILARATR